MWRSLHAASSAVHDVMTRPARDKGSWSIRLYARLLALYPPAFLQRHRAEMLQNFSDLEDAAPSKGALWLLIGRDLTMSLVSHFFASPLRKYVIGVLMAATIVAVDVLFFRNRLWERLIVNIGIVLVFVAFYLSFLKRP